MSRFEHPPSNSIRSRSELDIELARLTLRLQRALAHVAHGLPDIALQERREGVREWFGELAQDLLARLDPSLRAYGVERVRALAAQHPSLDRARLDPLFATVPESRNEGPRLH